MREKVNRQREDAEHVQRQAEQDSDDKPAECSQQADKDRSAIKKQTRDGVGANFMMMSMIFAQISTKTSRPLVVAQSLKPG